MMRTVKPDMVIISTAGWIEIDVRILDLFRASYLNLPVLLIGTESSRQKLEPYYESSRFLHIESPVTKAQLLDKCCEMMPADKLTPVDPAKPEEAVPIRKHILVVDDNPVLLRSVKAMLDNIYTVSVAISGEQALKMIAKKQPDLILLDYEMPGYDGKNTLERIRGELGMTDIPVIFLTGMAEKESVVDVLALKPAGYILKPPVKDKMIKEIEEALQKKQES